MRVCPSLQAATPELTGQHHPGNAQQQLTARLADCLKALHSLASYLDQLLNPAASKPTGPAVLLKY